MSIKFTRRAVLAVACTAAALSGLAWAGGPPEADAELAAWVDQRIESIQPSEEERRFDQIGWAADIREAERLAKEHGRPVFLFTHDGRIDTGRC
jgi:hypothetical protein